jgi:Ca2+-binding EF-hand superfamily protein
LGVQTKNLLKYLSVFCAQRLNYTFFLSGTDPEDVIKNAFGCFDDDNGGVIHEDRLRELLTTIGDRFTDEEVDEMYREAPIKQGLFDYQEFTRKGIHQILLKILLNSPIVKFLPNTECLCS